LFFFKKKKFCAVFGTLKRLQLFRVVLVQNSSN